MGMLHCANHIPGQEAGWGGWGGEVGGGGVSELSTESDAMLKPIRLSGAARDFSPHCQ